MALINSSYYFIEGQVERIASNNSSCLEDLHEDLESLESIVRENNREKSRTKKTKSGKKKNNGFLDDEAEHDSSDGSVKNLTLMINCFSF